MFENLFLFFLCLSICIIVHEFGHFIVAKHVGMKVREFSIGFGPNIISYTDSSNMIWKLSLIPFGGYIKVGEDDNIESSFQYSLWKRLLVIFCGPFSNFVFSSFIFAIIFTFFGIVNYSQISFFAVDENNNYELISQEYINKSISEASAINSSKANFNADEVRDILFQKLSSEKPKPESFKVEFKVEKDIVYYNIFYSFYYGIKRVLLTILMSFVEIYKSLFSHSESEIIGPLGIVTYSVSGLFNISSLEIFLQFTAMISITLGVANLLIPIFPLDGGMIILHLIQAASPDKYKNYLVNGFIIFSWIIFSLLVSYIMYNDIKRIFLMILY